MQLEREPLVSKIPSGTSALRKTFDFNIGNFNIRPEYWQAITIVVLLFLIVWTIARWRHLYVKWNLQGFLPSVAIGFALTLFVEGFFLIAGKTMFTEVLGWESAPKPISTIIDIGRGKLISVLGAQDMSTQSHVSEISPETVLDDYSKLEKDQKDEVKVLLCQ